MILEELSTAFLIFCVASTVTKYLMKKYFNLSLTTVFRGRI